MNDLAAKENNGGAVTQDKNTNTVDEAVIERLPQTRPADEFNQELVRNVRPQDWVNPQPAGRYNLVVIGAGTAGPVTAAGAAGLGAKVALIEHNLMGSDCLNVGCVPSKGIISAARISLIDAAPRYRDLGIDVYFGQAQFVDSGTVEVDGTYLAFKQAVIATGARAAAPPIPGLDGVEYLTNETLFSLTELPPRLGVIGAGPIGCEMAQAFAQLGSDVFLVVAEHCILPREDRGAAEIVQKTLVRDGVKLLCCGKKLVIKRDGKIQLVVESHGQGYDEPIDKLLVAVGRAPNVEHLNLEAVGVDYDKKRVTVNERMQTTNSRIYAADYICSPYQFTLAADFMARIVTQNALFKGRKKSTSLVMPWCTYTSPEIAHVGLYEAQAVEQGIAIDTFVQELRDVDRAILDGEDDGFIKVHVKKGTDTLVGATIVARHAGDMISEITLAMTHGLGLKIGSTIHPYPTQAETIRKLGDQYSHTRLTSFVKGLFYQWLAWTR